MDSSDAASAEIPFATARSIVSLGMFAFFAVSMSMRSVGEFTSPSAFLLSTAIRFPSLPHTTALPASLAPFWRFICAHLLCPDIEAFYTDCWHSVLVGTYSCRHDTPRICLRQTLGPCGRLAAVSGALFGRSHPQLYPLEIHDFSSFSSCPLNIQYSILFLSMCLTVRRSSSRG